MTGLAHKLALAALSVGTALCLAYAMFGLGLVVCTTPQATQWVGATFSGWEDSTYPEEDMATIAEEVRAYSIDGASIDDGLLQSIGTALEEARPSVAESTGVTAALEELGLASGSDSAGAANSNEEGLSGSTDSSSSSSGASSTASAEASSHSSSSSAASPSGTSTSVSEDEPENLFGDSELGYALSTVTDRYTLTEDALSHLKDCTPIFTTGRISTGVVGGFGIAGLVALFVLAGHRRVGATLVAASAIVFAVIALLGFWAATDFQGLFTWMHSLLFAQGNWTFNASSLLINLFPQAFWAAMAGLWIISSLLCATAVAAIGKLLR